MVDQNIFDHSSPRKGARVQNYINMNRAYALMGGAHLATFSIKGLYPYSFSKNIFLKSRFWVIFGKIFFIFENHLGSRGLRAIRKKSHPLLLDVEYIYHISFALPPSCAEERSVTNEKFFDL